MNARRLATYALLALLLAGTGLAVWRSAATRPESADTIAAQLLCPACQGESVAQSQSPMAAAMRDSIAQQLAAGRSPAQVRRYFVDRYGAGILTDPPHGGLGVVLWLLPIAVVASLVVLAWRPQRRGSRAGPPSTSPAPRRLPRLWDVLAAGVVLLVAVVAFAAPNQHRSTPAAADSTTAAPVSTLLALGRSLEGQGRYAEAAEVYRDAVQQQPDDSTRLRLAFALLRSNNADQAASTAATVLSSSPDDTEALLILGLAQRAEGSAQAAVTLRRFLKTAPDDPAAGEVRRLLGTK
ncbi:cytochrome c-type biogenesis protein CcmH [Actinoplanes sp. NPDC026619]|uniref:cytochrome c-type biogenesis protein CcmH n=1 Tax=Actinoplanes sp. NPDC026619 TaxID=3155798 RepID=UPI0033F63B83